MYRVRSIAVLIVGLCLCSTVLAQDDPVSLPKVNGDLLKPATMEYTTSFDMQGQTMEITSTRTVAPSTHDGAPVWHIVSSTKLPNGSTARDTFVVDQQTLKPIRRSAEGMGTMTLNYSDDKITGDMNSQMGSVSIDETLDAPVIGDGSAFDLYLAALPLEVGYEAQVRIFSPQRQAVRPLQLSVSGTQTIEVPAGSFDTYAVEIDPQDDSPAGGGTMYVRHEAPHHPVKAEMDLPAQMGGGTAVTILASIGTDSD